MTRRHRQAVGVALAAGLAILGPLAAPLEASAGSAAVPVAVPSRLGVPCSATALPTPNLPYYAIEMVKTGRVPGTGRSRGIGQASFARSPFGVSITRDGTYIYDLTFGFEGLKAPKRGFYTVWLTTPEIDRVKRLGVLDADGLVSGRVEWNKYLVVLTVEPTDDPSATIWSGPIVSRGMSRSGMMHTLAGHGPYENEPCAKYGFSENPTRATGIR